LLPLCLQAGLGVVLAQLSVVCACMHFASALLCGAVAFGLPATDGPAPAGCCACGCIAMLPAVLAMCTLGIGRHPDLCVGCVRCAAGFTSEQRDLLGPMLKRISSKLQVGDACTVLPVLYCLCCTACDVVSCPVLFTGPLCWCLCQVLRCGAHSYLD
jgi:hypothetical protein